MTSLDQHLSDAATAALAGTGTFIHESQVEATLTANYAGFPVIVYDTPVRKQARPGIGVKTAQMTLFFLDATPGAGDNAAARYATQDRMELLCTRFTALLDLSNDVEITDEVVLPRGGMYESMLDGVLFQFAFKVKASAAIVACLPGAIVVPPVPLAPPITNFTATAA